MNYNSTHNNFLTPKQCAQQFRLYAQNHPSKDSQHSLNFCANFLDEFCKQDIVNCQDELEETCNNKKQKDLEFESNLVKSYIRLPNGGLS